MQTCVATTYVHEHTASPRGKYIFEIRVLSLDVQECESFWGHPRLINKKTLKSSIRKRSSQTLRGPDSQSVDCPYHLIPVWQSSSAPRDQLRLPRPRLTRARSIPSCAQSAFVPHHAPSRLPRKRRDACKRPGLNTFNSIVCGSFFILVVLYVDRF
jgi:hypothetical protein